MSKNRQNSNILREFPSFHLKTCTNLSTHQYMGTFFPQCLPIFIVICFWLDSVNGKNSLCHFICTSLNINFSKKFISYSYFSHILFPFFHVVLNMFYAVSQKCLASVRLSTYYAIASQWTFIKETEGSGKVFYFMLRMLKFCSKVVQMFSPDVWNFYFFLQRIYIFFVIENEQTICFLMLLRFFFF